MSDAQAQINAQKPCVICGQSVGRIIGMAGRGRVTCDRDECHREHISVLRKAKRASARAAEGTPQSKRNNK